MEVLDSPVSAVIEKGQPTLIYCNDDETVFEALAKLRTHRISSLPVASRADASLVGVFDYASVLRGLFESPQGVHLVQVLSGLSDVPIESKTFWKELGDVVLANFSHLCPLADDDYCSPSTTLREACGIFGTTSKKRLLVVKDSSKPNTPENISLLSPSALVSHVSDSYDHPKTRSEAFEKHARFKPPSAVRVVSVAKETNVVEAFKRMHESGHTVLGILGPNRTLVGSLSASDIALIYSKRDLNLSNVSVWSYVVSCRNESVEDTFPFFGVTAASTLETTINKLRATKSHHVYVLDARDLPVGVVNFNDACAALA